MSQSNALGNVLLELTRGRPFVFVIMAYNSGFNLYRHIKGLVDGEVQLECIRADDVHASGHELLAKIHLLIERAELVIAEISEKSENVFYEIGYAIGQRKPLLLLIRKGGDVPTDLKGLELIEHQETPDGMEAFDRHFREHLRVRVNSRVAILRDMLEAENPRPAFIVASPQYPTPTEERIKGQVYDYRTFGDNLGIRGLMSAFGSMFGEMDGVELISAQYGPGDLVRKNVNLYLIGSQKVNPTTATMLTELQKGREPGWSFNSHPLGAPKERDWNVALYRTQNGEPEPKIGTVEDRKESKQRIHTTDYGIIVRGPHPFCPGRMVLIMAGAHSLGTGAACLAATRSVLIRKVKDKLPEGVDFADKSRTIWVLVKGESSKTDKLLDESGVEVVEAGCWK